MRFYLFNLYFEVSVNPDSSFDFSPHGLDSIVKASGWLASLSPPPPHQLIHSFSECLLRLCYMPDTVLNRAVNKTDRQTPALVELVLAFSLSFFPIFFTQREFLVLERNLFFLFARLVICVKGLSPLRIPGYIMAAHSERA